jgi:hypothetical protein
LGALSSSPPEAVAWIALAVTETEAQASAWVEAEVLTTCPMVKLSSSSLPEAQA